MVRMYLLDGFILDEVLEGFKCDGLEERCIDVQSVVGVATHANLREGRAKHHKVDNNNLH